MNFINKYVKLTSIMLATSKAFSAVIIGGIEATNIDTSKTRVASTFNYISDDTETPGSSPISSWTTGGIFEGMMEGFYRDGGSQLTGGKKFLYKSDFDNGQKVNVTKFLLNGSPFVGDTANAIQLSFTIGARTTAGLWEFEWNKPFGNVGGDFKFSVNITQQDIDAGNQFLYTTAITSTLAGINANPDGSYDLDNYGNQSPFLVIAHNRTGKTAGLEIRYEWASFISAVPEPSSYALIIGSLILSFTVIYQRRATTSNKI